MKRRAGPVILRENGRTVLKDSAAGYYHVLDRVTMALLAEEACKWLCVDIMCDGAVPKRAGPLTMRTLEKQHREKMRREG